MLIACLILHTHLPCLQLSMASPLLDKQQLQATQEAAADKRRLLAGLRVQRQELELARGAAAARLRTADGVLRSAHQSRLHQRQQVLQQAASQVRAGVLDGGNHTLAGLSDGG